MAKFSDSESHILSLFKPQKHFCFQEKNWKVLFSGKPTSTAGEPKTDIFVRCKNIDTSEILDLKISYKQADAEFLENKISAERAVQILGNDWSNIIKKGIAPIKEKFCDKKLVYKKKFGNTDAGSITLGWKFEFVKGTRNGDCSGVIPLSVSQKKDIYAGRNLPLDKKNAQVNGATISNSGVANYILIQEKEKAILTIQEAINNLKSIDEYVSEDTKICFACKALNYRTLRNPPKWDGNRPLAVCIFWCVRQGKLTPRFVFNHPLKYRGDEIANKLSRAMERLKIANTVEITSSNCNPNIVHQ